MTHLYPGPAQICQQNRADLVHFGSAWRVPYDLLWCCCTMAADLVVELTAPWEALVGATVVLASYPRFLFAHRYRRQLVGLVASVDCWWKVQ